MESCLIEDCDSAPKSRGLCGKHYAREQRAKYGVCSVDDCPNGATNRRGWCAKHYMRVLTHGTTDEPERRKAALVCSVDGCDGPARARGWCSTHWKRWRTHGSTKLPDLPAEMYCRGCRKWHPRQDYDFRNGRCWPCARRQKSDKRMVRAYRVFRDQVDAKLDEQDHRCAICRRHQDEQRSKMHVDHDHDTMTFRGMLCSECNLGLGKFRDSAELLEAAAAYLRAAS